MMRKYETMYILDPELTEEERVELITKFHNILTANGGKINDVNEWGIREFAYPIDHMIKGYYLVVQFEADPEAITEFDRVFKIEPKAIRHLIVNLD